MPARGKGKAKAAAKGRAERSRLILQTQTARQQRLEKSNTRAKGRKVAIRQLNVLLGEVSLESLRLPIGPQDQHRFSRVLRLLERRCNGAGQKQRLCASVQAYVQHNGKLPEGIQLAPDASRLELSEDVEATACPVPCHRVLVTTFELKSKAFMVTYNSPTFTPSTWPAFREHMKALHQQLGAWAVSACLEESLHAAGMPSGARRYHTHGYLIWNDGVGYRSESLEQFRFQGALPRVDKCAAGANARHPRLAALHGLWYVAVRKTGTIDVYANVNAWVDYKPCKEWLVSLWDKHKLDHESYMRLSVEFRSGHSARRREVLDVIRDEHEQRVKDHVKAEYAAAESQEPLRDPLAMAAIDAFVAAFGTGAWRRPFLIIVGATHFGKSGLARYVLRRLAAQLGLGGFLEVTVEEDRNLDLSNLRVHEHAGVLLDGVADVLLLKPHHETLQGQPKVCWGGKSSTMMYAYAFTLARRAVVATMDLSARNLHLLRTDHWLSNPQNVKLLWLTEPAFGQALPPAAPPSEQMKRRPVADVAAFLEARDAAALGAVLSASSVNGRDLARLTYLDLTADLGMTAFAARKVLALRTDFLTPS